MKRFNVTRKNGLSFGPVGLSLEDIYGVDQDGKPKLPTEWGKPERWVTADEEDVTGALETRVVEVEGVQVTEYKMPAQYTIQIEDMTAEIEAQKQRQKQLEIDETLRKVAREQLKGDIAKINDPNLRAALQKIEIILSKWN